MTLLDGVTGSGKTEIYFEAIAAALARGKQVLVLMPEIALTNQFITRCEERFGARPAEWHSGVSAPLRGRVWRAVAENKAKLVVGARSALFLPFPDLGLIVVDEEHDQSYKQEERVAYQARDMAVVRGHLGQAPVVLSSATPSIESLVNAEQGRYRHIRLGTRYKAAGLPAISAIDMRVSPPERGRWLSPVLVEAVGETLARGEQALLFLNRRGYAPVTLCRKCGFKFECPNCSAWLVEHRFRRRLECHHCGTFVPIPEKCPSCGAEHSLVPCGPGIERIAEEVAELFPEARRVLLSSDLTPSISDLRETLREIEDREVDVIIGTQLVAKGHHFPGLALVGVVDGDLGLAQADPRAAERTFQLLNQVTGRAGREAIPGRGLIQTYMPEHPVIQALVSADRDNFYEREIAARREAGLPPFGRLASLLGERRLARGRRGLCAVGGAGRAACRQDPGAGAGRGAAFGDPRPPPLPAAGQGHARSRPPGLSAALAQPSAEGQRRPPPHRRRRSLQFFVSPPLQFGGGTLTRWWFWSCRRGHAPIWSARPWPARRCARPAPDWPPPA